LHLRAEVLCSMKKKELASHVLTVTDLTKVFATDSGPITAVDRINFELSGDEFFTMLGPSGCGKTTTLRMVAGLEAITSGTIAFDGQDFSRFSPSDRNIGMVFQSYALFPHLTVFDNAAYGLRTRGVAASSVRRKVDEILDLLGLRDLASRYPADLSGGQQQRVSIARALVYDPGMLLLDEPLANLDAKLRVEMREEIRRIQKELGIMTIYVTHDQEEAMSVSDRLAVFDLGKLIQVGRPQEVYANPASLFVSGFIGNANFFPARVARRDHAGAKVSLQSGLQLELRRLCPLQMHERHRLADGFEATIMVRPEHLIIGPRDGGGLSCRVLRAQFLGSFIRYVLACADATGDVVVDAPRVVAGINEGDAASLAIDAADAQLFYKET
jgi:ABC-type Fe3+/spermidine/putrescine transport system ATPase subunit